MKKTLISFIFGGMVFFLTATSYAFTLVELNVLKSGGCIYQYGRDGSVNMACGDPPCTNSVGPVSGLPVPPVTPPPVILALTPCAQPCTSTYNPTSGNIVTNCGYCTFTHRYDLRAGAAMPVTVSCTNGAVAPATGTFSTATPSLTFMHTQTDGVLCSYVYQGDGSLQLSCGGAACNNLGPVSGLPSPPPPPPPCHQNCAWSAGNVTNSICGTCEFERSGTLAPNPAAPGASYNLRYRCPEGAGPWIDYPINSLAPYVLSGLPNTPTDCRFTYTHFADTPTPTSLRFDCDTSECPQVLLNLMR